MRTPDTERPHLAGLGGVQRLYTFANGYGASAVRGPYSYGGDKGLWELAVLAGDPSHLCYATPVTNDVIGHLDDATVDETLAAIEALPKYSGCGCAEQRRQWKEAIAAAVKKDKETGNLGEGTELP